MKRIKKGFVIVLSLCLLLSAFSMIAYAATFSDIEGHWAQKTIQTLADAGIISGKGDGTFQPNAQITRAEFFTLINNSFGFKAEANVNFPDVSDSSWFAPQIRKAVAAGYVSGYEDNTIRPNASITRNEMAVVLTRVLDLTPSASGTERFADSFDIPAWAKPYVGAAASAGLVNGDDKGNYRPSNNLTRAEAATVILNVRTYRGIYTDPLPQSVSDTGDLTVTGNYGPDSGTMTIDRNVIIDAGGITLRNVVIAGDLTITANATGEIYLNNVTVKGTVTILGGNVEMKGTFNEVVVMAKTTLRLTSGTIEALTVNSSAAGSTIRISKGAVVTDAYINAKVNLTGDGQILTATITVDGVTADRGLIKTYASGSQKAALNRTSSGGGGRGGSGGSSGGNTGGYTPSTPNPPSPPGPSNPENTAKYASEYIDSILADSNFMGSGIALLQIEIKGGLDELIGNVTYKSYPLNETSPGSGIWKVGIDVENISGFAFGSDEDICDALTITLKKTVDDFIDQSQSHAAYDDFLKITSAWIYLVDSSSSNVSVDVENGESLSRSADGTHYTSVVNQQSGKVAVHVLYKGTWLPSDYDFPVTIE